MSTRAPLTAKSVDGLLKALLVLSRTVDHVIETRVVGSVVNPPLSASKVQVLRLLGQRGSQTSTQVARYLGVSKPAVTQIADSMMRAKLVTRRTGRTDRREVSLQLSRKGRDLHRAIRRAQRHYIRNMLRHSPGADTLDWIGSLHKICGALAQADQAYKTFCAQCGSHEDGTCVLTGGDATCLFLEQSRDTKQCANKALHRR